METSEAILYLLGGIFSLYALGSIYFDPKNKKFYLRDFFLFWLTVLFLHTIKETGIINAENAIYFLLSMAAIACPLMFSCCAEIGARLAGKKD